MGWALGIGVHGVCTLDVLAAQARAPGVAGPFLVATDARRREVYWARYDAAGVRWRVRRSARPAEHPRPDPARGRCWRGGLPRRPARAPRPSAPGPGGAGPDRGRALQRGTCRRPPDVPAPSRRHAQRRAQAGDPDMTVARPQQAPPKGARSRALTSSWTDCAGGTSMRCWPWSARCSTMARGPRGSSGRSWPGCRNRAGTSRRGAGGGSWATPGCSWSGRRQTCRRSRWPARSRGAGRVGCCSRH